MSYLFTLGLSLSFVHDSGPPHHNILFLYADTLCHAVLERKASSNPILESLPLKSGSNRWAKERELITDLITVGLE